MKAWRSSKFGQIGPPTAELGALECLKNPHELIMWNGVATFSQLFLIGSFSYFQITMRYKRDWMSSKLGQF